MDAQHHLQWKRWALALGTACGPQVKSWPGKHPSALWLHVVEEALLARILLVVGLLVVRDTQLQGGPLSVASRGFRTMLNLLVFLSVVP